MTYESESKEQGPKCVNPLTLDTVLGALRLLRNHAHYSLSDPHDKDATYTLDSIPILSPAEIDNLRHALDVGHIKVVFGAGIPGSSKPRTVSQVAVLACTVRTDERHADRPPADILRAAFEERMNDLDEHHEWHEAVELDDAIYEDNNQPFTGFEESQ